MTININSYLAIEKSLSARLQDSWAKIAKREYDRVLAALNKGDYERASKIAHHIDLTPIVKDNRQYMRMAAYSALLFGATRLTTKANDTAIASGDYSLVVDDAVRQMEAGILNNAEEIVRDKLLEIIDAHQKASHVLKYNPNHAPAGTPEGGQFTSGEGFDSRRVVNDPDRQKELAHEEFKKRYEAWANSLTQDERASISWYQGTAYTTINGHLRGKFEADKTYTQAIAAMDSALNKAPSLDDDLYAYRGVSGKTAGKLKSGLDLEDKGFVSLSLAPAVARNFGQRVLIPGEDYEHPTVLRIKVPKGSKGMYPDAAWDATPEGEFILPHGSRFHITSGPKVENLAVDDRGRSYKAAVFEAELDTSVNAKKAEVLQMSDTGNRFVWDDDEGLKKVRKFNPNHEPAGSPIGGQFATSEGGTESSSESPAEGLIAQHPGSGLSESEILDKVLSEDEQFKYRDTLAAVREQINAGKESYKIHAGTDGTDGYTKERSALHDEIINDYIKNWKDYQAVNPTMMMLGGRGGSGKSSFASDSKGAVGGTGVYDPKRFLVVDSDAIKFRLAKADGAKDARSLAAIYHEESSYIAARIRDSAMAMKLNMVLDQTMKSPQDKVVKAFKDAGYKVEGHYMFLPREMAAMRAVQRYKNGGRLVPPAIILQNVNNEKNFDSLLPEFSSWSVWDNSGKAPKLVARSK